jgi:hypothetical protein
LLFRAYNLQDTGLDTVDANLKLGHLADERTYDEAALILRDLGVKTVRLLTNNSEKIQKLQSAGITVSERFEMVPRVVTNENLAYLTTKVERMNHVLDLRSLTPQAGPLGSNSSSTTVSVSSSPAPASPVLQPVHPKDVKVDST